MKTLRQLLEDLTDPRRDAMLAIYDANRELFHHAKGSEFNHQAWKGGYADHIAETIRVNYVVWEALNAFRELPFTRDQATICLFLHDVEKPYRYGFNTHPEYAKFAHLRGMRRKRASTFGVRETEAEEWHEMQEVILNWWMDRFGFTLTGEERNALKYAHGEGEDHVKFERVAGPLAAHVHHCDNTSARIYFADGEGTG